MATQTNKQVKIATDANFNNNKIVNAKIDANENTITGVLEELVAGNGITITGGNTISLKGTTQLTTGTDIDTITTEGNYFIDSPTSTKGLPDLPLYVMTTEYGEHQTNMGSVAKWLCLLLVEKQYGYGTYFIRQTITLTPVVSGYIQIVAADTLMFTRILSDSTYPEASVSSSWTKIDGDTTRLYFDEHVRNQPMTITSLYGNYTYMIGFNSDYSITGLTLTDIENTPNEIQVIFKVTTNNFTLTATQLQFLNYSSVTFEAGKIYVLTIKNLYATIDCTGEDNNLKIFVNETITKNDLQKRLAAGNNITITDYGWQGFSTTNNLELDSEHSDYVNLIKFSLSELNKNSTIFYTQYYSDYLSEELKGYLEITNENKLHLYYEYATYSGYYGRYVKSTFDYTGSTVLQANKYYWITQKSQGYQPSLNYTYIIEDNNYIVATLPDISEWTQQFSTGTNSYIMYAGQEYPAYIGYNPVNTNNYFSGVIQEFKTTNFNLSTAVEGTDFTNNGCVNGSVISATSGDALPTQAGNSGKFLTTDGTTASWATVVQQSTQVNTFNGTLSSNTLSLNTEIDLSDSIILAVYVNGIYQIDSTNYSITTSNEESTITFSSAFNENVTISIVYATNISLTNLSYNDLTDKPTIDTLLPTQTGNSGKFLTTNGTTAGWVTVSSGTTDYTDLSNKPSINGVTLTGNVSLSSLGVQSQNIVLQNTTITMEMWNASNIYPDYDYECAVTCQGATTNSFAQVVFGPEEFDSGNYANVCLTGLNSVTMYAKVNDTINIPTIIVMGA